MKTYLFSSITLLAVIIICCSDNPVTVPVNQFPDSIWYTDSLNNYLGGDSSNFCLDSTNCNIKPVFPNPVNNNFTIKFITNSHFSITDTISLYFLNSSTDTNYIIKNKPYPAGVYYIQLNKDSLGYSNQIVKLYFKHKMICSVYNNSHCSRSGNVKFN
jgi:hypothetical protein